MRVEPVTAVPSRTVVLDTLPALPRGSGRRHAEGLGSRHQNRHVGQRASGQEGLGTDVRFSQWAEAISSSTYQRRAKCNHFVVRLVLRRCLDTGTPCGAKTRKFRGLLTVSQQSIRVRASLRGVRSSQPFLHRVPAILFPVCFPVGTLSLSPLRMGSRGVPGFVHGREDGVRPFSPRAPPRNVMRAPRRMERQTGNVSFSCS